MTFEEALDASPVKTVVIEECPPTMLRLLSNGGMVVLQKQDGRDKQILLSPDKAEAFKQECREKKYRCRPLNI
jgi:hypothetical protein